MFKTEEEFQKFLDQSFNDFEDNEELQNIINSSIELHQKTVSLVRFIHTKYEKSTSEDEWYFIPTENYVLVRMIIITIVFQRKALNTSNYRKMCSFYDLGSGFNLLSNLLSSVLKIANKKHFNTLIPSFKPNCIGTDNDSTIVEVMRNTIAGYNFIPGNLLEIDFKASLVYYTYQPFKKNELMCKFVMRVLTQMPKNTIFIVNYANSESFSLVKKQLEKSNLKVLVADDNPLKIYFKQPGNTEINQSSTTKKK